MDKQQTSGATTSLTSLGDHLTVKAISEWKGIIRMDTQILVNDIQLCWVSGAEYAEFIDKLQNLVNEYRI